MASKIYLTLLLRQISMFVATFRDDSSSLFQNEQNALIHPGEYGMYRERCFCELLRSVLTRECTLSDGFIFSARDRRTTQCDILVKNAMSMPLTDSGVAKFHPVEDVYAIVEMKSNLTLEELTQALRKLAQVKQIGDDRTTRRQSRDADRLAYDPIPTFLVCNKLRLRDPSELDFDAIYRGIDRKYWHNAILSVEDGLFNYCYRPSQLPERAAGMYRSISVPQDRKLITPCPQLTFRFRRETVGFDCEPNFIPPQPSDKYAHIIRFLSMITRAIDLSVKYRFDSVQYLRQGAANQ